MLCSSQTFPVQLQIVLQFGSEADVDNSPLLIRPHLQIAAICEKHLLEADGGLSLIRIVDRFTVVGVDETIPTTFLEFTLAVCFKAGSFRGPAQISFQPISPSMIEMPTIVTPVNFEGDDERGINLIGRVKLEIAEHGLYWIVVKLEREEYTRIPFRVVYQRRPTIQSGS